MKNAYDNSTNFDVTKWSDETKIESMVGQIYKIIKNHPGLLKIKIKKKEHLKVILLNLWEAWNIDPTMYVAYHRSKRGYKTNSRYNPQGIGFKTVSLMDALLKEGFIEGAIGFSDRTSKKSRLSRIRANEPLIDIFKSYQLYSFGVVTRSPNSESIILRDKNKNDIEYCDTKETRSMRSEMNYYNSLLLNTFIDVKGYPEDGAYSKSKNRKLKINPKKKFVRRIFNNSSFEEGGRYYGGWWQHIPKEYRNSIHINNFPTCEVDYSGLHIIILYALEGVDYWKEIKKDPYEIPGFENDQRMRSLFKVILLTLLNSKNKKLACKAIRDHITRKNKEEFHWVKDEMGWADLSDNNINKLLGHFIKLHQPIKKYFHSSYGVKLQNIDSKIAQYVIREMFIMDIPVLCLHDSFIVPFIDLDLLQLTMRQAFRNEIKKIRINTEIQTTGEINSLEEFYFKIKNKEFKKTKDRRYMTNLYSHREHNYPEMYFN